MSNSCHIVTHLSSVMLKSGHSSIGMILADSDSVTLRSHPLIYPNFLSFNLAVGYSSIDGVPNFFLSFYHLSMFTLFLAAVKV